MPESTGFIEFAIDLLSLLGPVRARAMFGGHGLYCADVMIGLVDDDEVFLKTDDLTKARFIEAGCRQWVYPSKNGPMKMSYYRPPDDAHEDSEAMLPWARLALEAARRSQAAKRKSPPRRKVKKKAEEAKTKK